MTFAATAITLYTKDEAVEQFDRMVSKLEALSEWPGMCKENKLYLWQTSTRCNYKKAIVKLENGGEWASHEKAQEAVKVIKRRMQRIDDAILKLKR